MLVHELLDKHIDKNTICPKLYRELLDCLERDGIEPRSPEALYLMYGDIEGDLDIEQKRLDIRRTYAEIEQIEAEALKARSEAIDPLRDR